jgi:hypothetical protein
LPREFSSGFMFVDQRCIRERGWRLIPSSQPALGRHAFANPFIRY